MLLLPTGWCYQPNNYVILETHINVKDEDHTKRGVLATSLIHRKPPPFLERITRAKTDMGELRYKKVLQNDEPKHHTLT